LRRQAFNSFGQLYKFHASKMTRVTVIHFVHKVALYVSTPVVNMGPVQNIATITKKVSSVEEKVKSDYGNGKRGKK